MKPAAVLWTGGKDSALALHAAAAHGCEARCLVTFAPPEPDFLAHPLPVMALQARSLGLPHRVLTVAKPFETGYEAALRTLRDEAGIECVVTGDIAAVDGRPNWIAERCHAVGMQACLPQWGRDREALLGQLLEAGFRVRISCVDTQRLDADWVGRELDAEAIAGLRSIHLRNGLDMCGENGEYHTLVVDGPSFARPVAIRDWTLKIAGPLAYMHIRDAVLA